MPDRTVFTVLEEAARQYGNKPALYQPFGTRAGSGYRKYTWHEWLQISREIAMGLRTLGLQKGEIVTLLTETRAEFYLADLGIMGAGGVAGALYISYPIPEHLKSLRTLQPNFLFVEDAKLLDALSTAANEELSKHIILLSGEPKAPQQAITLDHLCKLGRNALAADPGAFARIQQEISAKDAAILYLTSGATGEPKMSLTSHAGVLANIDMGPVVLPIGPDDSTVVFLPSAHIAQRIVLELVPIRMGTPVWFSESLAKLPNELKAIRPTFFLAPPRVWERMYATIQTEVKKRPAWAKKLFYTAVGLSSRAASYKQQGKPIPTWMKRALKLADKAVFSKVRARLGGRLRIAISGAAPLGKELGEFFAAIGMPLIEGFGLTEAGILSWNPLDRPKPGSIGKLLPGVEARIAGDGEMLVRSPCMFMGYYNDPTTTAAVLSPDGWLLTGDIAETDRDGYWYITGRKKEVIVSSNGKKIYPARIESLFKMEPIINQVLLLGDRQPYVVALLTINPSVVQSLKGMEEFKGQDAARQVEAPPVLEAVQNAVAHVNKQLADFERIRKFKILERDFTIEQGELTPTMKIRRGKVLENHKALISELYLGREEST